MSNSGGKSGAKRLIMAATGYRHMGYSVIPVFGKARPGSEKIAAVPWKAFQQRHATEYEIGQWYDQNDFAGLAIITGRISGLVVLDFDDEILAQSFARQLPHLTQTRTIRSGSRGLPHYYYKLPSHLSISTHKCAGVDLQADGRYVVTSPTEGYTLERGGQPLMLTSADIQAIEGFLDRLVVPVSQPEVEELRNITNKITEPITISPDDLRDLYLDRTNRMGRNNALFQTALQARDAGYDQGTAFQLLAELHAKMVCKPSERPQERFAEAKKTIASAYSRPARKRTEISNGLPNSVREYFLTNQQTALVRVLDGLYISGLIGEDVITERQICDRLADVVGRYSVLQALKAAYVDGNPVFRTLENPSPRPPSSTDVAALGCHSTNNICILFRGTASDKNKTGQKRGRRPRRYILPTISELCEKLGIVNKGGDALQLEDVQSATAYRHAVNRSLIQRRPGRYTRQWLANRIGVSLRTWQRYLKQGQIQARATFHEFAISWRNLNIVPAGLEISGAFLRDDRGRRYPAVQTIARRLLGSGRRVTYLRQDANCYWVGPISPEMVQKQPETAQNRVKTALKRRDWAPLPIAAVESQKSPDRPQIPVQSMPADDQLEGSQNPVLRTLAVLDTPVKMLKQSKRFYRRELTDASLEQLARRLYERVASLCSESRSHLSMANARKLVVQYGQKLVKKVLFVLQQREQIENPAGFVWAFVRSEAVAQRRYVMQA
ncbi:MAG: bifunctional DNA primase/polymerase [Anaerolineae bacterium]|nr:bifunctional DNA primase/polymerase [Anaerolineae bacterium]